MKGRSGVRRSTAQNVLIDTSDAYLNIDEDALSTGAPNAWLTAIATATRLGGTRGGTVMNLNRPTRAMPVDGVRGTARGMTRRSRSLPTLTVNLLENSFENVARALASAEEVATGEFRRYSGAPVETARYASNVALIATLRGNATPFVFVLRNVLVRESPRWELSQEGEVVLRVDFAASAEAGDAQGEPWALYHPGDVLVSFDVRYEGNPVAFEGDPVEFFAL